MPDQKHIDLKAELDADPLTRGYSGMTDAQAHADLVTIYRPAPVEIAVILSWLLMEQTYRTNTGDDTQARSIWLRLKDVDALYDPNQTGAVTNPWGATALNITEIRVVKCRQLLEFFTLSAQGNLPVDLDDTNLQGYLQGAQQAECMSTTQETDLLALGNNRQSRAQEIGVAPISVGDVVAARAIV